jgi:trans-aconitate 2-methyltransferase
MAIDTWDPRQYDRFQREREQAFYDLLAMLRPADGMRVVDLGCGTGRLTRVLHLRANARETVGIDRSDGMLAKTHDGPLPVGLCFRLGMIEEFAGVGGAATEPVVRADGARAGVDLIFSNAALHWVEGHDVLIPALAALLGPSGQLAFQIPAQHEDASHLIAQELTGVEPFRTALAGWHRPQPVLSPEQYARLLYKCGFVDPNVRLIVYPHVLAGRDEVIEWMKGTLLTEYARHLPAELFDRFLDEYQSRLLARLEAAQPFFFPFKRILCWGQKPA